MKQHNQITAVLATSPESEQMMRYYADMVTGEVPVRVIPVFVQTTADDRYPTDLIDRIKQAAVAEKATLIISEWLPNPEMMQDLFQLSYKLKRSAMFIRPGRAMPSGRVVVATSGGPNICEQVWIAREISKQTDLNIEIFQWQPASPNFEEFRQTQKMRLEQTLVQLMGIQSSVRQLIGDHLTSDIANQLQPNDLLIMGAPSTLRLTATTAETLPSAVAQQVANPLLLLVNPGNRRVNLRNLFWGQLIKPQLRAANKEEALGLLIKNLIQHHKLPADQQSKILHLALQREEIQSTAVDCDTAFPHICLPDFFGVAGCCGIFPDGVDFGSDNGELSHFIFLLVTPQGFSEEYLTILAKIARRMVNEKVRDALLQSTSPAQALDVLAPYKSPRFLRQKPYGQLSSAGNTAPRSNRHSV